jgi:hypothetical protein
MRRILVVIAAIPLLALAPERSRSFGLSEKDVLQFSTTAVTTSRNNLSAATLGRLGVVWRTALPEGCDGVPLMVSQVATPNGPLDLVIAETTTGRLAALNAWTGEMVWHTEPHPGPRWTTSSPAVDPEKDVIYAYGLDGYVHSYNLGTGDEVFGTGFPSLVTRKGDVEKASSNLGIVHATDGNSYLYATVAAYPEPGDDGDYQGHLVAVNLDTGQQRVFNALCGNRTVHFDASGKAAGDCDQVMAGIWARPGVVYDDVTNRLFVTTGNGAYNAQNGGNNWGSSVVALRPNGNNSVVDSYTPEDFQRLTDEDLDLSSTTITILPLAAGSRLPHMGVQSGKDGVLRLLNLRNLSGKGAPRHIGGELDLVALPQRGVVLTQPVAWIDPQTRLTWVFVVSHRGIAAFTIDPKQPKLLSVWTNTDLPFNSTPVMLDGVLFMVGSNAISAVDARSGAILWQDRTVGPTHWQSPTIVNSMIYVCDSGGYLTAYGLVK